MNGGREERRVGGKEGGMEEGRDRERKTARGAKREIGENKVRKKERIKTERERIERRQDTKG